MKYLRISILIIVISLANLVYASSTSDGRSWWNNESLSTEGTEFYVTFMKNIGKEIKDDDFFTSIYATAHENAIVTLKGVFTPLDGSTPREWIETFVVTADGVNNLIIPHEVAYMEVGGKTSDDVQVKGIMVTSDKPISVYISNSNIDSYDAAVIYPIKALYKEYVIQTYSTDQQANEFALVSAKNDNNISINIQETFYKLSGEVDKITHDTINVVLDQGESYLYRTDKGRVSLTGTTICSTEPLAVYQGGQLSKISSKGSSSHICTQSIPTDAWGRKYIVTQTKGNSKDVIRITAAEENTKVYKNNEETPVAVLQPLETYEEFIDWSIHTSGSVVYTSSRAVECYLYQTDDDHGAPTFTDLTPLESSIHRTLFTTFKYRYDEETEEELQNFVNIVVPTYGVESVQLDGNFIPKEQFKKVNTKIDGVEYSYAQLSVSTGSHILHSATPFIAHVYGVANLSIGNITYSYSAGRNILHPAWILIDGQRVNQKAICEGDPPITFTSVINYDYTNVRWEFHSLQGEIYDKTITQTVRGDSIVSRHYIDVEEDSTTSVHIDSVYMIVERTTPICNYTIIDTIKAAIIVNDTFAIQDRQNVCYGDTMTLHYKGAEVKIPADTLNTYKFGSNTYKFSLNKEFSFVDSLKTNAACDTCKHCDSIINQIRIIRPIYKDTIHDSICVNHLPYKTTFYDTKNYVDGIEIIIDLSEAERNKLIGTQQGKYIKPLPIDTTIFLQTMYGCDSVINLHLEVLPIYSIRRYVEECKDSLNSYEWVGHTDSLGHPLPGHKIYRKDENGDLVRLLPSDVIPLYPVQTFVYYDSLQTQGCKTCSDAPGCDSIHILTLRIKDQLKKIERKNLCDNSSFVWRDTLYLGVNYNKDIPYPYNENGNWRRLLTDTLEVIIPATEVGVCDSICTMIVKWCPTFTAQTKEVHICEKETYKYTPRYPETHPHDKDYTWTCSINADGTKNVDVYTFIDTVETINKCNGNRGCDSIVHHIVYVHPTYIDTISVTQCQSYTSTYKWEKITEISIWDKQRDQYISPNDIPLDEIGDFIYIDSTKTKTCIDCKNTVGCDSIIVLNLHVNPIFDAIESKSLCETDTLHWRGRIYVGGKAADSISNGTTKRYWANPQPNPNDAEDDYRVPNTYRDIDHNWNGNKYTDSIHFETKDGCDSVYWLELIVYPSYEIHDTLHVCDNNSINWQGKTYAGTRFTGIADYNYNISDNWYTDTVSFQIGNSCDSVRILHLMVHPSYDNVYVDSVCQDYPYIWDNHMKRTLYDSIQQQDIFFNEIIPTDEPGWHTYVDRLQTNSCVDCDGGACDSIWTLRLFVKPSAVYTESLTICPEQLPYPYGSNGKIATQAGVYHDTIKSILGDGCDSITTYIITVSDESRITIPVTICQNETPYSYDYGSTPTTNMNFVNLTHSGIYLDTIRQVGICEQVLELHLTINDTTTLDTTYYLCEGDIYIDQDFNDIQITQDSSFTKRLERKNSLGCDSVVRVSVMFGKKYNMPAEEVILCERDSSYTWVTSDTAGTYTQTVQWGKLNENILDTTLYQTLRTKAPFDCDSIVSVHIVVKPTVYYEHYETICPTQVPYADWGNKNDSITASGTYQQYINGGSIRFGCDSIEILHLTISESIITPIDIAICNNEIPYNHQSPHETPNLYNLTKSGTYRQILTAASGCDSTVVLELTINDTTTLDTTYYLCEGDIYIDQDFNDIQITQDSSFTKRLERKNSLGCDSIVNVSVKFGKKYNMPAEEVILCERDSSYTWVTNDTAGTYTQTLQWGKLNENILDTTLYQTLRTKAPFDCDSIVSVHIVVKPTVYYEHYETICPTQVPYADWGNKNDSITASGTYQQYINGGSIRFGCDSIEILHLTISESIITPIDIAICNNEIPYNHQSPHETPNLYNLTKSGTYRQILTAASGCDSTVVLKLTINDTTTLDTTYYLCEGDIYIDQDFNNIQITQDSSFTKRLEGANRQGCDSIVNVTIKFGKKYNMPAEEVILCERDSSYTWVTSDTAGTYTQTLQWGKLNENILDTTLYQTLRTKAPFDCDSIVSVHIVVKPTTFNEYYKIWCASAGPYSYGEKGKTASATGTYIDTLITKNYHGCDSVEIVHLEWRDSIYQYDTIRICDNTIFAKHNKLYIGDKFASFGGTYDANMYDSTRIYSAGTYLDTITFLTSNGCDSTFYICVDVQNTHFSVQERNVCQFADVTYEAIHNGLGGKVVTDVLGDLQFVDTIPALGNGCDSIVHMTYHIRPHYHFSQGDIVVCQAKDSMWVWYNEEGHQDTISLSKGDTTYILGTIYETVYGCDSTYGISIYIAPSYHIYDTLTLCESDSLHWQGMLFVGSQYTQYGKTYDASIFDSTKVALNADTYDYAIRRGTNIYDCDSIHYLHLIVNPVERVSIEIRQCQTNEPYYYKNMNRGVGGYLSAKFLSDSLTRIDTLSTVNYGCDSIITLHFYVDSVYRYGIEYTFCQDTIDTMREWIDEEGISHGFVLDVSKAGSFTKSVNNPTIHGCDSTYGVTWHVNPSYGFDSIYTICQNERIDWQGRGYTGSKYGRKSEYISKQIINDRGDTIAIHSDSIYYEYENGDRILEAGTYYDTVQYTTHLGCDSTYCLKLIVLPSYDTIIDTTICDNAKSFSITYGTYQETISIAPINKWISTQEKDTAFYTREFTIPTINGCDSTMRLHLTVYPTYEYTDHVKICEFEEYEWHGKVYDKKGIYYDSLQTKYGCDSVHILDLFVKPVVIIPVDTNICDNQVLYHTDTLWYGVDSLVFDTVNTLLWKPGMEIPRPNQKRLVRYRAHDGCDSLVYEYSIHVHPTFHKIDTLALCSNTSFNLHDSLTILLDKEYDVHYTVAPRDTVFIDSLLSIHGCDSIFEAHATIYPAYRYVTDTSVCENKSIIWRGIEFKKGDGENTFTGPGDYRFYQTYNTKANGHACDSIYELRLHVDPIQSRVIDTTICADCPYLFADTLLNETGVYYDTIQTLAGCDSVLTLNLTVLDTTNIILFDTICVTEKCQWHGRILTESGDYDTITINEWGCKDYHYLHLNVIDTTSYSLEIGDVLCADDEEIWVFYQYTGRMLIEYSVLFDAWGHAQGFQDIHHAPLDLNSNYFSIPIPKGEVLPHPTPTYFDSQQGVNQYTYEDKYAYPLPQKYHMTIIMHNGICGDTLQRKDTIFDLLYPSWIHEQHWNDGIVLYNEQYNGGHIFTSYQWLQNGEKIIGATKEYFYIPSELWMNNRGECNNYYQVELTRLSDGYKTITCPICPVVLEDTIVPREDYYAIVPTTVVSGNPVVHILSTQPGTYTIYDLLGNLLKEPTAFAPDEKNYAGSITLPVGAVAGYYIVNMEMDNGDTRRVRVRVE